MVNQKSKKSKKRGGEKKIGRGEIVFHLIHEALDFPRVSHVPNSRGAGGRYGVFTWPSGDSYLGDWRSGQRHGVGLFRSADGREYCGQWAAGVRHGWGCLAHANGEEYEGEFKHGKVCKEKRGE